MTKPTKVVKSSELTWIWVNHHDSEAIDKLYTSKHWNFDNRADLVEYNEQVNKLSYAEYIEYDHNRTLLEQLQEIIADPTVIEVSVRDNTPNPNLDGANTLLRWEACLHTRDLGERGLMKLMDSTYVHRVTTFVEEAK